MTLNATSNCTGTATWSFARDYRLINSTGNYAAPAVQTVQVLNQATGYATPAGYGGLASTAVQGSVGAAPNLTLFAEGTTIPNSSIVNMLSSLYNGATANLLVGVAFVESSCRQFALRDHPTYAIQGRWPYESGTGGYIGLMQVPPTQSTLFDWTSNAAAGVNVFQAKLALARAYSAQQTGSHSTLPALTATQLEDEALWQYAGYLRSGHYYLPNATNTGWVVTTASTNGVAYVQNVRNHAGANCN